MLLDGFFRVSACLEPVGSVLFYSQTPGQYSLELLPGKYFIQVSGSGGKGGVGGTISKKGGNGEYKESYITLTQSTRFDIWVAGEESSSNSFDGSFGAVKGNNGEIAYNGSAIAATGGGGGGQSKVSGPDIVITADGGGGSFAYSGTSLNAKGGNGSGGALGGQSRENQDGANAGNGLGGKGAIYVPGSPFVKAENGFVKITVAG